MHATKLRRATFEVEMYYGLNHTLLLPLLALLCSHGNSVYSQKLTEAQHHWAPSEYGFSGGYALPHRDEMHALVTGHAWGGAFIWGKERKGGYASHGNRNGMWHGLEVGGTWAGSEDLGWIGHAIWLNRLPLYGNTFSEIGLGLGWASSPFDALQAPRSFALGSHANAAIRFHLGLQWRVRNFGAFQISGGLTHFSNGSVVLPNLGINVIGVQCSFSPAAIQKQQQTKQLDAADTTQFGLNFETTLRIGIRDIGLPGGVLHPTSTWMSSAHYRHRPEHNWSWSAALDIGYNQSLRVNGIPEASFNPAMRIQTAILLGARCHFGRTSVTVMQGWMMTQKDNELGTRHLHTSIQRVIAADWGIELGLRSFRLRADSPFIGLVWTPRGVI